MKTRMLKKAVATTVAATMVLSVPVYAKEDEKVTIDQIELGKDYTDIKADLKFLTHKTDVVDTVFKGYVEEFQKLYPNVNIEYEGITDYANDVTMRLSTGDWGDICMVPTTVDKDELENYFVSFGDKDSLSKIYESNMLNNYAFGVRFMVFRLWLMYRELFTTRQCLKKQELQNFQKHRMSSLMIFRKSKITQTRFQCIQILQQAGL